MKNNILDHKINIYQYKGQYELYDISALIKYYIGSSPHFFVGGVTTGKVNDTNNFFEGELQRTGSYNGNYGNYLIVKKFVRHGVYFQS